MHPEFLLLSIHKPGKNSLCWDAQFLKLFETFHFLWTGPSGQNELMEEVFIPIGASGFLLAIADDTSLIDMLNEPHLKSIVIYTLLIFNRLRAYYISMCWLFTVVSLTNFSWSRLTVSGARPSPRGRMLGSWSKRYFYIFFKAQLVPLICSTLTSSTSQPVLQA